MPNLLGRQIRALQYRAAFSGNDCGRFRKGVRDASAALSKTLDAHPNENGELYNALREFVRMGPVFDSADYEDGQACVIDDVAGVLDGDRETINDLLEGDQT
jgi:hypothetical protein